MQLGSLRTSRERPRVGWPVVALSGIASVTSNLAAEMSHTEPKRHYKYTSLLLYETTVQPELGAIQLGSYGSPAKLGYLSSTLFRATIGTATAYAAETIEHPAALRTTKCARLTHICRRAQGYKRSLAAASISCVHASLKHRIQRYSFDCCII